VPPLSSLTACTLDPDNYRWSLLDVVSDAIPVKGGAIDTIQAEWHSLPTVLEQKTIVLVPSDERLQTIALPGTIASSLRSVVVRHSYFVVSQAKDRLSQLAACNTAQPLRVRFAKRAHCLACHR